MYLRDWRNEKEMTWAGLARALGIDGVNPGKTISRIESGERQADAVMVERIGVLTDGRVTAADMHAVRLAWLKENRPDRFAGETVNEAVA